MKTEHVELIKSDGVYGKYTVFIEDMPNKVRVSKEDAVKYIQKTLFEMTKKSLEKHTKLLEEFFEWDKEG